MNLKNMINRSYLYDTICRTTERLDKELKELINKGIFFMPELSVAFELGKSIFKNRFHIFGTNDIEWIRELKQGDGISDIVFIKDENPILTIELKLVDTMYNYERDIAKLDRLEKGSIKMFLALIDVFEKNIIENDDPRIIFLNNESKFKNKINQLGFWQYLPPYTITSDSSYYFKTKGERYKQDIFCSVCLWEVNSPKIESVIDIFHPTKETNIQILKTTLNDKISYCLYIIKRYYNQNALAQEPEYFKEINDAWNSMEKYIKDELKISWFEFELDTVYIDYVDFITEKINTINNDSLLKNWNLENSVTLNE